MVAATSMQRPDRPLVLWAIYERPRDCPEHYVVRRWDVYPGRVAPGPATLHSTLDAARQSLPPGLARLERMSTDDPVIVETWV